MPPHPPETFAPAAPPYFLCFAMGFIIDVTESGAPAYHRDGRYAKPFDTFEAADAAAKKIIELSAPYTPYYMILRTA